MTEITETTFAQSHASTPTGAAIELSHVSVTALNEPVLRDVNMRLEWGSINVLFGASGSGKSSILGVICGLIRDDVTYHMTGSVHLAGRDMSQLGPEFAAQELTCVLQNPDSQMIYNRVEDEIAFSCENSALERDEITQTIADLCAMLKLDSQAVTRSLSGGQKERLCIAAALACKKRILVLDEPLASLDKEGAHVVMEVLKQLADRGYCIVIADHRTSFLAPYATRAFAVRNMTVCEVATDELIEHTPEFLQSYQGLLQQYGEHTSNYTNERTNKLDDDQLRSEHTDNQSHSVQHDDTHHDHSTQHPLITLERVNITKGGSALRKKRNPQDSQYDRTARTILEIDHFALHRGDVVLLMGDNGSGKTTLLNVLSGTVHLQGDAKRTVRSSDAKRTVKSSDATGTNASNKSSHNAGNNADHDGHNTNAASNSRAPYNKPHHSAWFHRLWHTYVMQSLGVRNNETSIGYVWQHPDVQLFGSSVAHEMALREQRTTPSQKTPSADSAQPTISALSDVSALSAQYLKALDLDTLADRHPQSLSEGQKRRLVFAATLAADPEVILLDEPFAGQDTEHLAKQVELLGAHCAKHNGAVVLSTHDVRGILGFINRVVWLDHGRIVADMCI